MTISVIIPTYNEAENLLECLNSLKRQKFKDFEVVVVDDGSSDNTKSLLENLVRVGSNFKYKLQNHKGAGAARNLGSKMAKGQILVFVDADMTFDEDFLSFLTKPIIEKESKGTFSSQEFVANWENVWAKCWNINEGWEEKRRHPKNYPDKQAVFRAILKSEFEKVGGFTAGGYDDDWSLSRKLGYMADAAKGAIFYHKNPSSLGEIFNHAKWVGKRGYKLGNVGSLIAAVRSSLPISIVVGVFKALVHKNLHFILFKIVYDFGILVGIFDFLFTNNGAK